MGIHGLWVEISFLNIFWQKNILKTKYFKFLFQYLENDPLNVLNLILDIIYRQKFHFWTSFDKKYFEKKYIKFVFQYLENDPLNVLNLILDIIFW